MKHLLLRSTFSVLILLLTNLLSGPAAIAQSCANNNIGFNSNSATNTLTICAGTSGTTINGAVPAGSPTYQWQVSTTLYSGPFSTVSPDPGSVANWTISSGYYNTSGAYYFRRVISGSSGCDGNSDVVSIIVKLSPTVTNNGGPSSSCAPTGYITLYGSSGLAPYTYSLDGTTYQSGNTFNNLAAGTYTGYVKDAIGCIGTKPNIVVTSAPAMNATATSTSASGCINNGSISLFITGGNAPYTYSLDDVTYQSSNVFSGLGGGTYTGWVKDSKGCKASRSGIVVSQPTTFTVTESHVNTSNCTIDGSIQLRSLGGTIPYTYSLDDITYQTSATFSGLNTGNYTGWVKDLKGCKVSINVIIGQKPPIVVNPSVVAASSCAATNGSIALYFTGGTSPFTYSLNGITYQSSNSFTQLLHGIYTGYVKDSKGCIGTKTNITVAPQDGTVTLTSGAGTNAQSFCSSSAISNITYAVGGSGTGATVTGLPSGVTGSFNAGVFTISGTASVVGTYNYTVTVTGGSCTQGTANGTISVNAPPSATFTKTMASSCGGGADGTITVTATGGTSPYTYSWTGPGGYTANTAALTNLAVGDYTITVTDNKGCVKTIPAITIWQAVQPSLTNSGSNSASCTASGSIILYGGNGIAPYTYSINGTAYQSGGTFTNLAAGTYTGYIKDLRGCVGTKPNIVITAAAPINVTASTRAASNCASSNGFIQLFFTGGIPPYSYSLDGNNYQTSPVFSTLTPGTYTGYVKDSKICIGTKNNIVVGPSCPAPPMTGNVPNAAAKTAEVPENNILKIKAYPNPTATEFTLQLEGFSNGKVSITVTDVMGTKVYQTEGTGTQQYKFGNKFKTGIYNVQVVQGDKKQSIKLVKE